MDDIYRQQFDILDDEIDISEMRSENMVYSCIDDKTHMRKIQRKYGSTSICNIPPYNFFVFREQKEKNILYIIYENDESKRFEKVKRIVNNPKLSSRYNIVEYIHSSTMDDRINTYIPDDNSLILCVELNYNYILNIISLGIPFCIFCDKNELFQENLKNYGMNNYIIHSKKYSEIKKNFSSFYSERKTIKNKIRRLRQNLKDKISLLENLQIVDKNYVIFSDESSKSNDVPNIINFYVNHEFNESENCNFGFKEFYQNMTRLSCQNGIYLDLKIVKTFITNKNVHYYPWIGLVEYINRQDILYMIKSDTFINSISMCYGLFVLNSDIYDIMKNMLKKYKLKIPLKIIEIPKINVDIKFNLDKFKEYPLIVNFGDSRLDYCCPKLYNQKLILEIESQEKEEFLNYTDSVIVLSSDYPSSLGIFYNCICTETPVILRRQDYFENILGEDYPLFTEKRSKKHEIIKFVTEEKIERAYTILKNIDVEDISEFWKTISNSHFGHSILKYDNSLDLVDEILETIIE